MSELQSYTSRLDAAIALIGEKLAGLSTDRNLRSTAATFAVRVGAAGLAYLVQVLLARTLELQDYGTYVNLWAWMIIGAHVAVLGFSESVIRFVPRYLERGRTACAHGFLKTGFGIVTVSSLCLAALALGVIGVFAQSSPPEYVTALTVAAIGLPFITLELYLLGVCRSLGYFMLGIVPGYIARPMLIGCAAIGASSLGYGVDAGFVLASAATSTALMLVVQCQIIRSRTRHQFAGNLTSQRTGLWLRASVPLLAVYGIDELFHWSDIILLGLLTTPDQLGIYFAAARSMALAGFIQYAFMIVSSREFSIANAASDLQRLQAHVTMTSKWSFWLTVPAVLITLAFSYPLLAMFGPAFVSAIPVTAVLGLGLISRAAVGNATDLMVILGHQKTNIAIALGALTVNLVVAVMLVPVMGILGAAVSTAVAQTCHSIALAVAAWKLSGLKVLAFHPATDGTFDKFTRSIKPPTSGHLNNG